MPNSFAGAAAKLNLDPDPVRQDRTEDENSRRDERLVRQDETAAEIEEAEEADENASVEDAAL